MGNISQKYLEEIKQSFSSEKEFETFLNSCQMPLKKSIKVNLHKISPKEFIEDTLKKGWILTSPKFIKNDILPEDIFYVDREDTSTPLGKTFYHQSGFFYVQEVAAGLSARHLFDIDSTANEIILDMSAAPGGKSSQIGDYLQYLHKNGDLGLVISNDLSKQRLLATGYNLNRMGIFNNCITNFNGFAFGKNLPEFFDKVLLDAPCSGEGTGFKSDFGLKYWRKEEINKIASTQYLLLVSALKTLKTGGVLVYSTCTMNPYENEYNIKKLLEEYKGIVQLEDVKLINKSTGLTKWNNEYLLSEKESQKIARFWPHIQKTGGFFIAKIRKIAPIQIRKTENKLIGKRGVKFDDSKKVQNKIKKFLEEIYGIKIDENKHYFIETKNYVFVTSPAFKKIKGNFDIEKIGTAILKKNNYNNFRPTHHLGIIFGHLADKNIIEINNEAAQKYALGNNLNPDEFKIINIENPIMNYVIIKYKKWGIGVGKYLNGGIKNKYLK